MKRIEFIGASGVGKSTLFREILKLRHKDDKWLSLDEMKIKLAKTIPVKETGLLRLSRMLLRMNLFPKLHVTISSQIINSYNREIIDNSYERYEDLALEICRNFSKQCEYRPVQKLGLASFLHRLIVKDIMPFDYFKTSDLVIYDEGIIHNVSIFGDEIIAKRIYEEHSTYGTNLIPAGVVYCFTSLEENLRRRNLRICQNKGTMLERNLDVDERRLLSTQSLELAQNKIAILKSLNINVLELDMENSIECNAKLATEYIKSFL